MINKNRSGWKRRNLHIPNKLLLALMILISVILLVGGPEKVNSDLTPSTQDLDQSFFALFVKHITNTVQSQNDFVMFVKEQFLEVASGRSALTGAVIGLPVQDCYDKTVCVNETKEECQEQCSPV